MNPIVIAGDPNTLRVHHFKSVAQALIYSTVRIDTTSNDGSMGSGTGFIFTVNGVNHNFPFVVTNKHVVEGTQSGAISFHHRKPDGSVAGAVGLKLDDWSNIWFGHPDPSIDVAITSFEHYERYLNAECGVAPLCFQIPNQMVPTRDNSEIDAIETVTFVGYPDGIWDDNNFLPIVRQGITATPYALDFQRRPEFLIDASVFPGSSGSPVFVADRETSAFRPKARLYFLGLVSSVYFRTQHNELVPVPAPTHASMQAKQTEFIDLGVVVKARTILETIGYFLTQPNIKTSEAIPEACLSALRDAKAGTAIAS